MAVLRTAVKRKLTREEILAKNEWRSPVHIVDRAEWVLGGIDLDPCWNPLSHVRAKTCFTKLDDGLSKNWGLYRSAYINPPYSRDPDTKTTIRDWMKKTADTYLQYGTEMIALVPVAVSTVHFQSFIYPVCTQICWVKGRLKFIGAKTGANFESAVIYYGRQRDAFEEAFEDIGRISIP